MIEPFWQSSARVPRRNNHIALIIYFILPQVMKPQRPVSLATLPDDVILRIIQILLAYNALEGPPSSGKHQCPHVCALSAVCRRLQRLVLMTLAQYQISLHTLSHHVCTYVSQHQSCTPKRQHIECTLCRKPIDELTNSAIRSFSSPRMNMLYITPACRHDALSSIAVAAKRFCMLTSINIVVPQTNFNIESDGLASDNLGAALHGDSSQSVASALADIMAGLPRLVHLTLQSYASRVLLHEMSAPYIAPDLRSVELVLPSRELLPALLQFLSQPDRVLRLRDIRCSIRPRPLHSHQQTYACEYSRYENPKSQPDCLDTQPNKHDGFNTSQLATHLLGRLSASSIAVSSINVSLQSAIDTPDEFYSCPHCGLDKNADVHHSYSPCVRHQLYSFSLIKPRIITDSGGRRAFRASFSTCMAYGDVLGSVLPFNMPIQCVVASQNVARIVRPSSECFSSDEDGCLCLPVVATSLRSLFPCFPPRYDQLSGKEDLSHLKMIDITTTTIERDPFSGIPSLMETLHNGKPGELRRVLSTASDTIESVRIRPFPLAWHRTQEADKSLTLRVLQFVPNVRIFDVYICVLCSFLRQTQLQRLFAHMRNLQILHVSESPPGSEPATTTEQPDVITGLLTIPRLLAALLKSCNSLKLIMWHATHTCRFPCSRCCEDVTVRSLTRSFGSPLGHAIHALERFKEKMPNVNTESLQRCLDRIMVH